MQQENPPHRHHGIHMGHYKIATMIPQVGKCLAKMISLPFLHCFSPKRWTQSIHFMLEKLPGIPKLNKLRIIQLLEADFNAILKVKIGRQLMTIAENNHLLGEQMHGGRSERTTTDALIMKHLIHDISSQNKQSIIMLNLDATKCYDRIFPNLATLPLARLGAPLEFGATIAQTLKYMEHRVLTGHGLSENNIK